MIQIDMQNKFNHSAITWLLEEGSPGVRFLTMRDLLDCDLDDLNFISARKTAHTEGPIAKILDQMEDEGYWSKPGPGYLPKYRSTVWSLFTLGQLGASVDLDDRINCACSYLLDHGLAGRGRFTSNGAPSGTVDCLQGNLLTAFLDLGFEDPRLEEAFDWMARSVTGEGVAPNTERKAPLRYYAGKCGPDFACGANNKQACAWGAIKVMLAFSKLPVEKRTPLIKRAIKRGVDFLFGVDPATAEYPSGWNPKPSRNWWKFGFPVYYVTDLLQNVEALVNLGYGRDPHLANALDLVREKQDDQGRWPLEYSYSGKTWVDFGPKNHPNKWVTLRALRVLKAVSDH